MPRAKPRRSTRKRCTPTRNKSMMKLRFSNYIEFSKWLATTASPDGELVYLGSYPVGRQRIIPTNPNRLKWRGKKTKFYVCTRNKERVANEEIRRIKSGMSMKRETPAKREMRIFSRLKKLPCKAHIHLKMAKDGYYEADYWWKHTHDDDEDIIQQPSYITELRNEKYDGLGGWSLIGIPLEETRELLDRTLREIVMKTVMPPTFTKAEYTRASERVMYLGNLLGFDSDSEFALVRNHFRYTRPISEIITSQKYTRARNWLMTSSHLLSLAIDAEVEAARMQVIRSRLPRPLSATAAAYHRVSNCV
ncbi:hypothetical protein BDF22DRAFT_669245 [Syncephalis plumigaleata]|nr:hypothetical protein BDF22DRAFT_669245 [Syncephalis plumigaleata]